MASEARFVENTGLSFEPLSSWPSYSTGPFPVTSVA